MNTKNRLRSSMSEGGKPQLRYVISNNKYITYTMSVRHTETLNTEWMIPGY